MVLLLIGLGKGRQGKPNFSFSLLFHLWLVWDAEVIGLSYLYKIEAFVGRLGSFWRRLQMAGNYGAILIKSVRMQLGSQDYKFLVSHE